MPDKFLNRNIFRKGYSNKKETVAKTEPQQPNNAISSDSSLSDGKHNGIMPSEPNGESTVSSGGKDTEFIPSPQENQTGEIGRAKLLIMSVSIVFPKYLKNNV